MLLPVLLFGGVVVAALGFVWWHQLEFITLRRLLPVPRALLADPPAHGLANIHQTFAGSDAAWCGCVQSRRPPAWHIATTQAPNAPLEHAECVVVYVHGNGGTRAQADRLLAYANIQQIFPHAHLLVPEMPGYGDAAHEPADSFHAARVVAIALSRACSECSVGKRRVVLWAHSLGAHIALRACHEYVLRMPLDIDLVVLEAPFTRLSAVVSSRVPYVGRLLDVLLRDRYDNVRCMPKVSERYRVVVVHGADDVVVPPVLGRQLADAGTNVRFVLLDRASHNTCTFFHAAIREAVLPE